MSNAKSITIPNTVKKIDCGAFSQCYKLENLILPEDLDTISNITASYCTKLKSINIPKNVKHISDFAFSFSGISSLSLPEGLTSIGQQAFIGNPIENLYIPSTVEKIGNIAFSLNDKMKKIIVDKNNKVFDSRNNCNAIIETKSSTLILGDATTIIPDNIATIRTSAFYGVDSLLHINIPASVSLIKPQAFYSCKNIRSIKVDANNKYYDSRDNCNAIIDKARNSLILGSVNTTIPGSVKKIGNDAFNSINISEIQIPANIDTIGNNAFYNCKNLYNVRFSEGLKYIGNNAFMLTSIDRLELPKGVNTIKDNAFSSITTRKVTLPSSLRKVAASAFNCYNIETIVSYSHHPEKFYIVIPEDKYKSSILYVPIGTKEAYQQAEGWKKFMQIEEIDLGEDDETTSIHKPNSSSLQQSTYNIAGLKVNGNTKGITIVKLEDGTTRKILNK